MALSSTQPTLFACADMYVQMGYTMRTSDARFTVWLEFNDTTARPIWPAGGLDDMRDRIELFDLRTDDGRDFDFDGYSLNVAAGQMASAGRRMRQVGRAGQMGRRAGRRKATGQTGRWVGGRAVGRRAGWRHRWAGGCECVRVGG